MASIANKIVQRNGGRFLKCVQYRVEIASRPFNSSGGISKLENLASEAEKVVGYQASLLRCLLSDEISSVVVQSKKLVGSRHPLLKTARRLVYDGAEGFDAVGLIVLLMSRCGEGLVTEAPPLGQQLVSGIQKKQRKLAEVAELINTGISYYI
jgi:decaprenyl-diphosphate synthase subunit 2